MSSEHGLVQAALSHLELALLNISEQARHSRLKQDDHNSISAAAYKLQQLASQGELSTSMEASHPSCREELNFANQGQLQDVDVGKRNEGRTSNSDREELSVVNEEQMHDLEGKIIDFEAQGAQESEMEVNIAKGGPNTEADRVVKKFQVGGDDSNLEVVDVLQILMDAFSELDSNNNLCIQLDELRRFVINLGFRHSQINTCFLAGKTHDGLIYQAEWYNIARKLVDMHSRDDLIRVIQKAHRQRLHGLSITQLNHSTTFQNLTQNHWILSYRSHRRMCWDICMLLLLVYVALTLPLEFAFSDFNSLRIVNNIIDWVFLVDLVINFRTTYQNDLREEVWDPRAIAIHYLRTWFFLDLLSSLPLEQVSAGFLPRTQPAKLLKFGKVAKATKMLRISRLAKLYQGSEIADLVEEIVWSHNLLALGREWMIVIDLLAVGHWLACLLLACGGSAVDLYLGDAADNVQKYTVALYWAIQSMTTVGYGDVPMQTDWERLYAVVAMIIGGAFYGYIIGVMSTLLSHQDMDRRAFTERMDVVVSWLNNHYELSPQLRRRVWKHFKDYLTATRAVEDSMILNDLPPKLRDDVSLALMKDSVRNNPLLENLSMRALSKIVNVMTEINFQADEVVVDNGDAGKAMFIIDRGFVNRISDGQIQCLCAGDHFGEEVLLRDITRYTYTIKTHSKVRMFRITREDFSVHFNDMHQDVAVMMDNFYRLTPDSVSPLVLQAMPGHPSLIAGGPSGTAPSFSEAVMDKVSLVAAQVEEIRAISHNLIAGNHRASTTTTCPI